MGGEKRKRIRFRICTDCVFLMSNPEVEMSAPQNRTGEDVELGQFPDHHTSRMHASFPPEDVRFFVAALLAGSTTLPMGGQWCPNQDRALKESCHIRP
jgi:hypothetical protein